MNKAANAKLFVVVISTVLLVASAIHAKDAREQQVAAVPAQEKPGEQKPAAQPAPETLQLLKGMPRQQIMGEMRKIAAAMGTECNFCHVQSFLCRYPSKGRCSLDDARLHDGDEAQGWAVRSLATTAIKARQTSCGRVRSKAPSARSQRVFRC